MGAVVWLLLLAVAAVVAAVTFGANDGLVSIVWGGWRAELSLNFAVIVLLVGGAAAMVAAQALLSLLRLPERAAQWRALRRERAAQAALREALAEYFSARYTRAHKAAQKALGLHFEGAGTDREFALLAGLLSAGSLHRLSDRARRDEQWQSLAEGLGGAMSTRADDGARLLAAEWALDDRDAARAMGLLSELPPGVARRTQALRLRLRAAQMARQPLDALHTARLLAKHQAFSPEVARSLLRSLANQALSQVHDVDQLTQLWERLDPADRRDPHLAAHAAEQAARLGAPGVGRGWLRPHWTQLSAAEPEARERLAQALIRCVPGLDADWLPVLEAALTTHGHEPAVQAAAGTAFAERQLWGKARQLLEPAARSEDMGTALRRLAWLRLGSLARDQGDEARAAVCDRAAADLGG